MTYTREAAAWTAGALAAVAAGYAAYAGAAWLRYGRPRPPHKAAVDPLLDRFMPVYDVVERHHIAVAAPADVVFAAACAQDLMALPVARAIFKTREIVLGARPDAATHPRGVLAFTRSIGWGTLAEIPGREIVMGAVTQPWQANVVFRPMPPDDFLAFNDPDYVKIAWTLRADANGANTSIFRTETRALATDRTARSKFRLYWSLLSAGIIIIRWASLRPLKAAAENGQRSRSVRL